MNLINLNIDMPFSYLVYGSLGFVIIALLLFFLSKRKDR
jgi:hypothetical protein